MVSRGVRGLNSWGEGGSLALVGQLSSDGVTIKIPSGIDVLLRRPAWHHIFLIGLLKTESLSLLDQLRLTQGDESWR